MVVQPFLYSQVLYLGSVEIDNFNNKFIVLYMDDGPTYTWATIDQPEKLSEDAWMRILIAKQHPGNVWRSAHILTRVIQGMEWMRAKIVKERMAEFVMPKFNLLRDCSDPNVKIEPLFFAPDQNAIFLHNERLAQGSFFPQEHLVQMANQFGVSFRGTVDDYYLLSGVHETDHAWYTQTHEDVKGLSSAVVSTTEYDAQPHEYSALSAELQAAEAFGIPELTKDLLRVRLQAARLFQQKK